MESASAGGNPAVHHVSVNAHVDEGLQYWLDKINFRIVNEDAGPPAFSVQELRKAFTMQDGAVFDVGKDREGLEALQRIYGAKGYIDFISQPSMEIDQVDRRVSLTVALDEQTQFRVRKVEVLGLDPGWESLLRSRLRLGDIFNTGVVEAFCQQHRAVFSSDWRSRAVWKRDVQNAAVDLLFDFRPPPCPPSED